jgi:rod shape-determining protein MreC
VAFGTPGSRSQVRGPSPGFRFTLYAFLSFVIMFLDQRHGWMEQARFVLQALAYPIQLAVSSPTNAWNWFQESLATRDALRAENDRLKAQDRLLAIRAMRYEALARENGELRALRDALPPVAEKWLAAEIVNIEINSLRQRVLINRGTSNGVFKGQALLDDKGVIGQTTHVGPWSAEAILITDPEHAIPVVIERTGLRSIAVGAGDSVSLALPFLPGNADVKAGDLLLTSGLGGVFPAGYPVARVTEVRRDAVQPLAQVRATPFASVDADREVVLVWFREDHPAAPASTTTGDLKVGNPKLQPQAAPPPRPKPGSSDSAGSDAAGTAPATPTTPGSPAGTGAQNSARPSGTVNPPAAAPSKTGTPAAATDGSRSVAPNTPKEPAAGEKTRAAAPKKPATPPASNSSPVVPPRNP